MAQPSHGPRVVLLMGKLLPPGLVASIAEGPPAAVLRALGQVGGGWGSSGVVDNVAGAATVLPVTKGRVMLGQGGGCDGGRGRTTSV